MVNADLPSEEDDPEGFKFFEETIQPVLRMKEEDEPLTLSNMKMILSLYTSLNKMSKSEEVESSYIKNMVEKFKETYSTESQEESEDAEAEEETQKTEKKRTKVTKKKIKTCQRNHFRF